MKKKSNFKFIIFFLTLTLLISIVSMALFAWAKYIKKVDGTATAKIASWSFKVTDSPDSTSIDIDLAETLMYENNRIEDGYVAPGTEGAFNLIADANGSEVSLVYNIEIDVSNIPENLKFYSDAAMKNKVITTNGKIRIEDYIGIEDSAENKKQTKTIYWKWAYQTGMSEYEKGLEDRKDSYWMGKPINMNVSIISRQVAERPTYLADNVEIGDYVGYNSSSEMSFSQEDCLEGAVISDEFNSDNITKWRVLYIDRLTRTVEIMSEEPTSQTVTFTGKNGYKNAETVLNEIGAIYGNGSGAVEGRSIKLEDIMQYSSYNPYTYVNSNNGYHYGDVVQVNSGRLVMEDGTEKEASSSNKINMTYTHYSTNEVATENFFEEKIYKLFFKQVANNDYDKSVYWLASRCVYIHNICYFSVRRINAGFVSCPVNMFNSMEDENSYSHLVVPVVTLNSNVKVKGKINDIWQLDVQ